MTGPDADAIAVALPDQWEELPLEPGVFDARLQATLEEMKAGGVQAPDRRRLELLQRQVRDLLLQEDVRHAATLLAVIADTDGSPDPGAVDEGSGDDARPEPELVAAASTISVADRRAVGAPGRLTVELLLRSLPSVDASSGSPIDLDPPSIVLLPAGRVVRLARLHRARVGPAEDVEFVVQSYLAPFDDGERLCTLQFVTPNVEHGGAFSGLFDAIARTLRIFREDEPTTFDEPTAQDPRATDEPSDPETAG